MAQGETVKQDAVENARRNWPDAIARSDNIATAAFARAGFRDPTLVLRWAEIVGPDVARFTAPLKLSEGPSGGVLTLKAEPAAATFLQHETRRLCERINAFLGRPAIARLKFVPGSIEPPPRQPRLSAIPGEAPPRDPARGFAGPDPLKASLLALARARQRPSHD